MPYAQEDIEEDDVRQRVRDQVQLIRSPSAEVPDGAEPVAIDTQDAADHNYLFRPGVVLVNARDVDAVNRVLAGSDLGVDPLSEPIETVIQDLGVYPMLSDSTSFADVRKFLRVLGVLDDELGEGVVTPDHYLHVAGTGGGRPCPAHEPYEVGTEPWPEKSERTDRDDSFTVSLTIADTGWWEPAGALDWLGDITTDPSDREEFPGDLPEYAGHGTFVTGVARCRARQVSVRHRKFLVQGGAVRESAFVRNLNAVLAEMTEDEPHVILLCAGGHTRSGLRMKSFRGLWHETLSNRPDTVLVAAAGNDGTNAPFYPAAFGWALGVGSLDNTEGSDDISVPISSFSNYGSSADIYVVGRNHINAFPTGTYVCKETPDKGSERHFNNQMARWSGTSFAAALVAGLIAAERNVNDAPDVTTIARELVGRAVERNHPWRGPYRALLPDSNGRFD